MIEKEDLTFLKSIEDKLYSIAIKGYARGLIQSQSEKLRDVLIKYNKLKQTELTNLGCTSCIIKLYNTGYEFYKNNIEYDTR